MEILVVAIISAAALYMIVRHMRSSFNESKSCKACGGCGSGCSAEGKGGKKEQS